MAYQTKNKKPYYIKEPYGLPQELDKKDKFRVEKKEEKHYYYKWGKHHYSKYGGQDGTLEVYEVENGEIKKVGETFIQTRAFKGYESEAMSVLYKEGKISKEEFDKDSGYYRRDKNNFKISEL